MTAEIAIVLALLALAMTLFALEWVSFDVVTLLLLAALAITGVLTPAEAFSGFANEVIVVLASMFVIAGALAQSGVMQWLGRAIHRAASGSQSRLIAALMGVAAALSALFSNTTTTAVLMPAAMEASGQAKLSASRVLMPLAFGSILGGTCTLIGTSTNIAASGLITTLGLEPYTLFEFSLLGAGIAVLGIAYMALAGFRLIPRRQPDDLAAQYGIERYLSELIVVEGADAIGRALGRLRLTENGVSPLAIVRDGRKLPAHPLRVLQSGDRIIVKAPRDALLRANEHHALGIEAETTLSGKDLSGADVVTAEAVLMPQSKLIGTTLKQAHFYRRFGAAVLAIYRRGHSHPAQIENMRLRAGDVLLLQGAREAIGRLGGNRDLWGLSAIAPAHVSRRKGAWTLAALTVAVIATTLGLLPMSIAFLLAAGAVVLMRVITVEDAYAMIEWPLIVLIAGMTAFGLAMQKTGAAAWLAAVVVEVTAPFGMTATLAVFALLTVLLTQPMSNAAAALVVLPVAVATAAALDANPRTFAVLVTLSASLSFMTPLEPASLLVYGPGKYRFTDFLRAGLPLTLLAVVMLVVLTPVLWPL